MRREPRIGAAAAIVAGGVLLSRILGYGRDLAMAALLGRNAEADLYQFAFTIPDYAYYLVAGGFLSITLIPILARHIEDGDPAGANAAFTAVFRTVGVILVAITGAAALLAGPLVDLVFPEVIGAEAARLVGMTRLALVLQVLFALGALFSAAQFVRRRFLIPTLGPILYNGGIIVGGLIGNADGAPTPESFIVGGLVGALLGSFGLQWVGARAVGVRFARPERSGAAVREYLGLAIPLMVGQTVIALDEQWPRWFGQFGPEGTASGLQYARRLTMLPVGVIAQAAGVAAYPFLARLAARGDREEVRATVTRSLRAGLTIAVPATVAVVLLSEVGVRVAFQWGEFGRNDTDIVAGLLALYALAIPFWVLHQVVTRAFYAERRMWAPVIVGTSVTGVTIPALFAVRQGDGSGIAAVSAAAIATYAIIITALWYRRAARVEVVDLGRFAARLATAAAAATVVTAILPVERALGGVIWPLVFGVTGWAVGIPEVRAMTGRLVRPR